ncbi:MAG: MEDS domain-containing protein [Anaerolineae bacterium]|nr:MEDS domain-containing protein [Anaerolineae bacterium]
MHIHTSDQPILNLGFGGYTCNWGVHIAGLYESEAERDAVLFGYLSQGDRDGDLQGYCPTERTSDDFRQAFSQYCPDCVPHLDDPNRFQLTSARDLYYPDGTFSPWAMDDGLNDFYADSQRDGPRNIRATAEMVWALEAIPGVEHLMAYESRLNYFIPGKPWISICLYNLTKFSGATIMDVLRTHPYTISGGIITENPYYQDPDQWLAENAPEFLPAARQSEH